MSSICLVGCGKMGSALLDGWIEADLFDDIYVIDPSATLEDVNVSGAELLNDSDEIDMNPDMIVFAVKPQILPKVAAQYAQFKDALFVSIAAGTTVSTIQQSLGFPARVIRVMPNTPAAIGKGMSVLFAGNACNDDDMALAESALTVCGKTQWVDDENLMHVVTSLSGSGPAYVFHMVEAMAQAAQELGLDKDTATVLARQTMVGAASLLEADTSHSASELRKAVTSPNGTTQAGLDVLMHDEKGLFKLMYKTLRAAKNRSIELSQA